jgi:hypothetical protein
MESTKAALEAAFFVAKLQQPVRFSGRGTWRYQALIIICAAAANRMVPGGGVELIL